MDMKLYAILKGIIEKAGMVDVNELKADVDELYSLLSGRVYFRGETTTPLQDQATTNPILINNVPTEVEAGNLVLYNGNQFVFDGTKWILLDNMDVFGDLAYKNSVEATYTPTGTVSKPSFTGNQMNISATVTPSGTVSKPTFNGSTVTLKPKVTAAGTVSKPNINITPTTKTVNSITNVGSLPTLATVVSNETLSFTFGRGTLPTKGVDTSVLSGVSAALANAPVFTGTQVEGSVTYTPSGTVSKPTFTGSQTSVSVTGTPSGSVSQPIFTGIQATIVSE